MPDAGGDPVTPVGAPETPSLSWRDRVLGWRDRLLADPAFHRFASRFWLTRPIVRREAAALFDLTAGFVYSQVLAASVRLDLFRHLANAPRTSEWLASRTGLPSREVERLLEAGEALRLFGRRSQNRWGLGQLGAAVNGTPGLPEMIRHHALLYDDMTDPVALLRTEGREASLHSYWTYAQTGVSGGLSAEEVTEYSALMAASQRMLSDDILDTFSIDRFDGLLDVGGGEGEFILRAADRSRSSRLAMFDLPAVADIARRRIHDAGLASRVRAIGGDFLENGLPDGFEAISLIRVLYDHDDQTVARILSAARAALPPGGTLIVAEPMNGSGGEARVGAAYFGFYLLAMGGGRARSPQQIEAMLRAADFERIRVHSTAKPMLIRAVSAKVPG